MDWLFMKIFSEVFTKMHFKEILPIWSVFVHPIVPVKSYISGVGEGRIKTCRKDEGDRLHPEMQFTEHDAKSLANSENNSWTNFALR